MLESLHLARFLVFTTKTYLDAPDRKGDMSSPDKVTAEVQKYYCITMFDSRGHLRVSGLWSNSSQNRFLLCHSITTTYRLFC
jgi:hypothetical protein